MPLTAHTCFARRVLLSVGLGAIGLLASGDAAAADRLATKPEALQACLKGCRKTATKGNDPAVAEAYCSDVCTCIVDGRFDEHGKQTQSASMEKLAAECAERVLEKSKAPTPAP